MKSEKNFNLFTPVQKISIVAIFLIFILTGCNIFRTSHIPESKFVNYYIEFVIMQDSLGKDKVSTTKILEHLNKKYQITQAQYESTLQYYGEEPARWEEFFNKVLAEVKKRQQSESKKL